MGAGNRSCATLVVGGDVNVYHAVAALIAAVLYEIERKLQPPEAGAGHADDVSGAEQLPATLAETAATWSHNN
ncbi:hypothetical protein DIJ64_08630 [Mycobacterium leprae]|uniref:GS catalytic domain-containing protein n=1 Tax=Mycobacterium leprae TaxID=1769 RepID=A0AAD0P829_MYCLR|nr:hypothetical protein [Mycobacterium leprae]AWV48099.1 hypothetical protein DIJ64_08630 [Mycobacterium leprae]OAR21602.1 hypothetical protein A8144_04910 [Mycobacterium leprae 3125609]OAX71760.1 hypothetical protein A3216_03640 [Mycobacterium leprae 7935681]